MTFYVIVAYPSFNIPSYGSMDRTRKMMCLWGWSRGSWQHIPNIARVHSNKKTTELKNRRKFNILLELIVVHRRLSHFKLKVCLFLFSLGEVCLTEYFNFSIHLRLKTLRTMSLDVSLFDHTNVSSSLWLAVKVRQTPLRSTTDEQQWAHSDRKGRRPFSTEPRGSVKWYSREALISHLRRQKLAVVGLEQEGRVDSTFIPLI